MKQVFLIVAALGAALSVAPALAADVPAGHVATPGKMLVDASGARLAPVYRVDSDGSAEIVFEGHMVVVPAATLSIANGKLTTSMKKSEVIALR